MEEDLAHQSREKGSKSPFPQDHSMMPSNSSVWTILCGTLAPCNKSDILTAMFAPKEMSAI